MSTTTDTNAPLAILADAIATWGYALLSTDLFDTVLLRDHTSETERFAIACRRTAPRWGVDPDALTRLRWSCHDNAYRAVAMERPEGDATLSAICRTVATSFGLDEDAARILRHIEVEVDVEHLRPNRPLLALLNRAADQGTRIVAVSDTYYDEADLRRILHAVVGVHPIAAVYSSADIGLTKHSGHLFDEVTKRENVSADQILHMGDHSHSDVDMARGAACAAVHLPRARRHRAAKVAGALLALPTVLRRMR